MRLPRPQVRTHLVGRRHAAAAAPAAQARGVPAVAGRQPRQLHRTLAARVAATGAKAAELHGTYRPRVTRAPRGAEDYVRRKYADAYEKGYAVCPGVWVT